MENKEGLIWYNGKLIDWKDAKLHVLTHGLHYASSVFEGERSYSGRIFKLHEHTERLFFSASELDFEIPFTIEEIKKACYLTLEKNNLVDAYIRPIAWREQKQLEFLHNLQKYIVQLQFGNGPHTSVQMIN